MEGEELPETPGEKIARLKRFYNVETLEELVWEQAHHVEKLQIRDPNRFPDYGNGKPNKQREG